VCQSPELTLIACTVGSKLTGLNAALVIKWSLKIPPTLPTKTELASKICNVTLNAATGVGLPGVEDGSAVGLTVAVGSVSVSVTEHVALFVAVSVDEGDGVRVDVAEGVTLRV
jgi:hypothetical protein